MYYPEDVVEEVRTRNDIVDVISGYVKLQKKGANYFGLCPFHNEKSPSFSVSPQKQMYYCFGCGAGGNAITFIMEYENYTFPEALKVLADRAGVHLPEKNGRRQISGLHSWKSTSWQPTIFTISCISPRESSVTIIFASGNCPTRQSGGLVLGLPIKPAMTCISICAPKAILMKS